MYLHGGDPRYYFKKFGISERSVIDFSVNVNPFGPPDSVKKIWKDLFKKIHLYPTLTGEGVKKFYKKRLSIPENFILPGNGSTEIIYLLPKALDIEKIAILKPSYYDYERAFKIAGKKIVSVYINPFRSDQKNLREKILHAIYSSDAVFIGRPNNPVGYLVSKETIIEISKEFPKKWIIVDEAFIQFVKDWEKKTLMSEEIPGNVLVIHSLTKFYALAGIRIGALIAKEDVIRGVSEKKEPWTVNIIAESIAEVLSECYEYEKRTVDFVEREKERIVRKLDTAVIDPIKGEANFILCRYRGDIERLILELLKKGIYIRDCRNFDGLEGNFFRIAIRKKEENEKLISAITNI